MESLKVMEKFDGGNFHLWKFKLRMMLSKHGLWKFVDGSATIPHDEDQITNYNEKATKAFALLCEHLTNAQLAHIQYCENVKSVGKHFAVSMKPRPSETSCFFEGGSSPSKCKKGRTCLRTSTW
jgi:hypothetical protein